VTISPAGAITDGELDGCSTVGCGGGDVSTVELEERVVTGDKRLAYCMATPISAFTSP